VAGVTRRRARRRAVPGLVVLIASLLLATGCASIPASSRPQVISRSIPTPAGQDDDVRYDELVPREGELPDQIVREFIRAGGSYERGHARARAYLTPEAAQSWKDDQSVTILENTPYLDAQDGGRTVHMTVQQRGRLEEDGAYVPGETPYPLPFRLKKVDGNWRIDNPPNTVLIESSTFDAAYRAYEVYFLNATRSQVVPDIRWYAASRETLPDLLVTALERGPSKWLQGAVLSDLEGVTLQNNVEPAPDRLKVYLTGLDDQTSTLSDGGFAQLAWTLDQVGVGGVEVYSDGRLLAPNDATDRTLQQLNDWRGFDPNGPFVSSGYLIRDGAVWTTKDTPVPGPAGSASFRAHSVAVSTDERSLAVVTGETGQALYVGAATALRKRVEGRTLTRPTWGGSSDEVWTVQDGDEILQVLRNGQTTRVTLLGASSLGPLTALRLSRDGSRVAMVAGRPGARRLWIGVVVRDNGQTKIDGSRPLEFDGSSVTDVSWADSLTVVALVRNGRQNTSNSLFTVDISGMSSSQLVAGTGLPTPPTAVAAGPSLPLLTVAASRLWRTPATGESWSRASENDAVVSQPTYPG
jgi:hypothetical protein